MAYNSTANMLADTEYYDEDTEYKNEEVEEYGEDVAPREIIEKKITGFDV